ncbi:hypothetical protein [Natronomonas marina]|jgi:hypothetical protein|uniref:hypothetical protein n=1 Tax=Natronomonas marina TaxID=2961939 RepID=UPI0020C9FDF0|nr:hypothetical protein [Natronomonas marina]
MTPEDVKASDSDQVTISFDVSGRHKVQVDAAFYDHAQKAKRVRDKISSKHFGREAISGIGIANDGEHHVLVTLDANSPEKDERRGELPERQNDVRIKIEERSGNPSPRHSGTGCSSHSGTCNDQTTGNSSVPGGVKAGPFLSEECTLGSRTIAGSCKPFDTGWSLPVHCLTACHDVSGEPGSCTNTRVCSPDVEEDIFHNSVSIGTSVCYDEALDFTHIEQDATSSPESEIVLPSDHSDKVHITDTVSDSGLDTVMSDNLNLTFRGINSCEVAGGNVDLRDVDKKVANYCRDSTKLQVACIWDNNHETNGDSGAVMWVSSGGNNYAIGCISVGACAAGGRVFGPQGHSIQDRNNIWWTDL